MKLLDLVQAQLDAYNRHDLDAFCACYHPQVQLFEGEELVSTGREAFRERYAEMFAGGGFGASVPDRLLTERHCVDLEKWWIQMPGEEREEGTLLARYSLREGLIGAVQFLD